MNNKASHIFFLLFFLTGSYSQEHPKLILTKEGVRNVRSGLGTVDLFDKSVQRARAEVDKEIENGIEVPVPKDMAGAYSHERHKRNFFVLQMAGNLYQITQEEKYAQYIKDNLMAYAKMYPTLPLHPTQKSYAIGKLFWQCLNDANWLVYVSQAYDAIYNFLSKEEREFLEKDLFRPYAKFLSEDNPRFFNRIHNHCVWANAAVGMIALVMDDEELLDKALYGLPYIEGKGMEKGKAGFLAQLDYSISPDGYFTEGPYYARYAIFPFLIFSKALMNKKPELDIMNYRDGILAKAILALLNQTDSQGKFFPLNDAQKGMSWKARELIAAVDILYHQDPSQTSLLDIAKRQDKVLLDETGFAVAKAIQDGKGTNYIQVPATYGDGKDGDEGGIGILRSNATSLVLKYSSQGGGHGHFDKLSYSLYDEKGEVIQDYGSARWVNVDQKGGGRYLKENGSFAKHTIAHNTVVLNQQSHFGGKSKKGGMYHPSLYFSEFEDKDAQVLSVIDTNAYENTSLHRTMIMLTHEAFPNPFTIDVFRVLSDAPAQIDLPLWFHGQLMDTSFEFKKENQNLTPLGDGHGYQHIWKEAEGRSDGAHASITWFNNNTFYSSTMTTEGSDVFVFGRSGANDPDFNLRNDPVFIHRKEQARDVLFTSVVETHGNYNRVTETPMHIYSSIDSIENLHNDENYSVVQIHDKKENSWVIAISNASSEKSKKHTLNINGDKLTWEGPYLIKQSK